VYRVDEVGGRGPWCRWTACRTSTTRVGVALVLVVAEYSATLRPTGRSCTRRSGPRPSMVWSICPPRVGGAGSADVGVYLADHPAPQVIAGAPRILAGSVGNGGLLAGRCVRVGQRVGVRGVPGGGGAVVGPPRRGVSARVGERRRGRAAGGWGGVGLVDARIGRGGRPLARPGVRTWCWPGDPGRRTR